MEHLTTYNAMTLLLIVPLYKDCTNTGSVICCTEKICQLYQGNKRQLHSCQCHLVYTYVCIYMYFNLHSFYIYCSIFYRLPLYFNKVLDISIIKWTMSYHVCYKGAIGQSLLCTCLIKLL